ncbi:DUF7935 family protein [Dyadobacter fanqingshengii]|uniref:Uncharacterized protein n=1 Tax=Dyadobacter fanqingshengii TaxID=2906443 RepID=A0A9X1T8H9_9BACT|nr:hypothetical protein [Dyadobacter fanqingshengii]MCF0039543.1 hypothetical protein [Dyadobacter fanqingshengii]USJ33650.1 hypothetical protein NFI81_13105 [Dyadobacter fanqingshengii]
MLKTMEYYSLLVIFVLGIAIIYGIYATITTVAAKLSDKQRWEIRGKHTDITLPLRLQAYERMCLFLERITPNNLLLRLVPSAMSALELQQILLHEIREEYNHNVAQQLYISANAWEQVTNAMNETVAVINQASTEIPADAPPADLAKKIFSHVIEKEVQPASHALKVLKEEIRTLF